MKSICKLMCLLTVQNTAKGGSKSRHLLDEERGTRNEDQVLDWPHFFESPCGITRMNFYLFALQYSQYADYQSMTAATVWFGPGGRRLLGATKWPWVSLVALSIDTLQTLNV